MLFKGFFFYFQPWRSFCSVKWNHFSNFGRGSPKEHFCGIILESGHWPRRCRLKVFFLFLALAAILFSREKSFLQFSEQQIILGAFGYLTPSKFSHLGKITLLFFSLSENTPKMKSNWVKHIQQKERAQKKI